MVRQLLLSLRRPLGPLLPLSLILDHGIMVRQARDQGAEIRDQRSEIGVLLIWRFCLYCARNVELIGKLQREKVPIARHSVSVIWTRLCPCAYLRGA